MPLGGLISNDMWSMNPTFYEFSMHMQGDIDLSLLSFYEICRLNEHELRITSYMKDVVIYEVISTKFISYFQSYNLLAINFQSWRMDKYNIGELIVLGLSSLLPEHGVRHGPAEARMVHQR
jgi:hypothetical protein